jgi:membrane-bound lytic murein transglycosylase D
MNVSERKFLLNRWSLYTFIIGIGFSYFLFSSHAGEEGSGGGNKLVSQVIEAIRPSASFSFAGEPLPMDNFDVRERLDRELTVNAYWHSSTLQNIKNSARFFPVIEEILEQNGIPEDFKYLAVAESSLTNASSPAGAKGIWQFMEASAEAYGLEVNREIDERYHLEKSTEAACRFLKDYYSQFGSWTLAAAAYNMGAPRLKKEMEAQRMDSYYDMNLNAETSRYIFRIVAVKEILSSPQKYGFYLETEDLYPPLADYSTVSVDTTIQNLGDFALKYGTTYRMLKVYNPWLLTSSLPNKSRRTYELKIPR